MISIVIPTYNRATLISNVLDNLLAQTNPNWQCVIVDDHSTDNTAEVVQQYVAKDPRFVYRTNNRAKGAQGARNTGILAANGEWICLFDSDDIMYPNYLERMFTVLDEKADVIVCKALIRNNQTGKELGRLDQIKSSNFYRDLLREKCYVAYDVTLIRKEKLLAIGLLDEQCPSMQEWDTHIRLSKIANYKAIDDVLCEWVSGGEDAISSNIQKHIAGRLYIYRKHRWNFRKHAYTHWLHVLSNLWWETSHSREILLWAPELMLYIPLRKLLSK